MAVMPDLLAGRIDMFIGAINSLLPLIQEGKLHAIAATSLKRIASLPDVPTLSEEAFPGFEVGSGVGLVVPAGTPPDVVETLNREIASIIAAPGFHQRMAAVGVDVVGTTRRRMRRSSATTTRNGARWSRLPVSSRSEPISLEYAGLP
jgi:tripartite-type tricarboxylate transporter receptor subunit TctC